MAYITPSDLRPPGSPGSSWLDDVSSADQLRVCEDASSTADSYFSSRFGVPLPFPSGETKRRVRHVAIYELLVARGLAPDNAGHMLVITNYQDSIRWFEGVAKGLVTPTLLPDATPSFEEGGPFVLSDEPRGW